MNRTLCTPSVLDMRGCAGSQLRSRAAQLAARRHMQLGEFAGRTWISGSEPNLGENISAAKSHVRMRLESRSHQERFTKSNRAVEIWLQAQRVTGLRLAGRCERCSSETAHRICLIGDPGFWFDSMLKSSTREFYSTIEISRFEPNKTRQVYKPGSRRIEVGQR